MDRQPSTSAFSIACIQHSALGIGRLDRRTWVTTLSGDMGTLRDHYTEGADAVVAGFTHG